MQQLPNTTTGDGAGLADDSLCREEVDASEWMSKAYNMRARRDRGHSGHTS